MQSSQPSTKKTKEQPRVLVTGVFDILHQEHMKLLRKAAQLGYLLVGLESDKRVRELKGEGRPINDQQARKENIEALELADEVFILPEQFSEPADHRALLEQVAPDVLAVSAHSPHLDKKASLMQAVGGKLVIVHQHNPAVSTTKLLAEQEKNER